ncbi:class A beta-lactamase-related serine hydrolase [Sinomicrobium pectinilyticum]|uniref:Class A beta-lactamase-related serine hydrolase n=1 Tax=Sinomicrobium pectinilyticum TaxID=1084421 RepID=A0A3N0F584_SINP1|nr:serine hydrolase domain-containing protein [Sinomicrobium pectinilyticum]RNL95215.1 class A beta-lactamase-related serine hydrolase [Sinomicrobium pectinilyticum]
MYSKLYLFLITATLLLLFSMACTREKKEKKQEQQFINDTALENFFDTLYTKKMFNGAVAVKKDGVLIFKKTYGKANMERKTPFTPHTAMEIASVSKQFTAAAIQLLQQQGKLETDLPAYNYLGQDFPYRNITVKNLLTHTSGLPDYEDYFRKQWDTTRIACNADILAYFKEKKPALLSSPGTEFHYSNSGFVLLAEIVRAVSGKTLDVFLRENIFEKAGMVNSGFYERDSIWSMENYAPAYRIDPATCTYVRPETLSGKYYYRFLSGRLGPGRLSSSLDDLIRWDSILYTDKILNAESKKTIFRAYPPSTEDSDYGFGWHIRQDDSLGKIVYHTGSWAGNLSYIKRFTKTGSLVIILNNTFESAYMKDIRRSVDAYVKGKPLRLPRVKAHDRLQKEICQLNASNITDWQTENRDADWDRESLEKLEKTYIKTREKEKANIVSLVLNNLRHNMTSDE